MVRTVGFIHQFFPFGGAETATIRLSEKLSACGFQVYVFCNDYRKELAKSVEDYCHVCVMPDIENINAEENTLYLLDCIRKYSVATLCFADFEFSPILCQLREVCDIRLIYIQHVQPFWEKNLRLDSTAFEGFRKLKVLLIERLKERLLGTYTKRYQRRYANIYDHCDLYVTLHPDYSKLIEKGIKRDGNKFRAIANMVEPGFLSQHKKKQLLFCGRMSFADKRVDRLLKIWAKVYVQVPEWELILVGDGKEKTALETLTKRLKLPRVRFEGWKADVKKYYQEASIICLTSAFEAFGLCLTEAMSYGCVPIAYDCSAGVRDIVQNNGFLIPPFCEEIYADRLLEMMKNDDLRIEMQRKSFEDVQRFYPKNIVPQWIRLFE